MAELGDPQSFKRALRELVGEAAKEEIEAAVHDAVDRSDRILREVARDPPPGATMESWSLETIADSVETYWSPSEPEGALSQGDAYVAEYTHPHADKIEVGVKPHQIEGDPILVFPWYNAPDEVRKDFRKRWDDPDHWLEEPEVIFAEVEHPGIPAVGYIRGGFQYALRKHGWL
jgi:hypothetical protein